MMSGGRSRFPFSARQWEELEQQALVYKYMVCGMPIPPDLLFTIRTSLHSSLIYSSKFLLHQPQNIGWSGFEMGFGRKIDPEPGRCRRTDGKKWRCSKEAYPDSKYCERHMHRGRNRSRKPVETSSSPINNTPITVNSHSSSTRPNSAAPSEFHFLNYTHNNFSNSSRPPQENNTKFFLDNTNINAYSHSPGKHYRNSNGDGGMKLGETDHKHGLKSSEDNSNSCWQMAPLTMGSSQMKDKSYDNSSGLESLTSQQNHNNSYYNFDNIERPDDHQPPKKVMHHFLDDQWPPKDHHKDSWPNPEDHHPHKLSTQRSTQLSISVPNSLHDFFITQK